jgi:hypothetical protein
VLGGFRHSSLDKKCWGQARVNNGETGLLITLQRGATRVSSSALPISHQNSERNVSESWIDNAVDPASSRLGRVRTGIASAKQNYRVARGGQ